ncbi:hypothetical protein SAMN02745857_02788 [Andreprevotia lacus DSM 23236]|jgi:hypothetical protein|uniref:Uncharacterized protein n=1 Tax=Andreprevotia lacus DSM 23236 TaxID=1121001 RepID=A0A1W1XTR9_9NEIS|nr:hypothetical protein [Andreprevotia lacus]SMC27287.1 hypothetical protein SAMN02745857_02788 [Andreprevotia lacus DSM 23236]
MQFSGVIRAVAWALECVSRSGYGDSVLALLRARTGGKPVPGELDGHELHGQAAQLLAQLERDDFPQLGAGLLLARAGFFERAAAAQWLAGLLEIPHGEAAAAQAVLMWLGGDGTRRSAHGGVERLRSIMARGKQTAQRYRDEVYATLDGQLHQAERELVLRKPGMFTAGTVAHFRAAGPY